MHTKKQEPPQTTDAPIVPDKEEEYLNGWKRALADYENLKKQTMREKEEYAKFANLNLIVGLIPVYEHLLLSFEHLPEELKDNPEASGWIKGIEHIKKQFKEVLEFNGVEEIEPQIDQEFNPELHEAVENTNEPELENSTQIDTNEKEVLNDETKNSKIIKVLSHGFKLQGRVFKPAKVIVHE
ncbi:MAG TPA: nucleotide exchange factor GrpE [bacterium]|nr:nucleotide exchange factor GrpE [bacterium]